MYIFFFCRLQNAAGLFSSLHCNILMVEYRGYGQSKGYPSENGIYMDAQAALDFLAARPDVNQTQIVVFGRSLGMNFEKINHYIFFCQQKNL